MNLQKRIDLLIRLGQYISGNSPEWKEVKERAQSVNNWFVSEFVDLASNTIAERFLKEDTLASFSRLYNMPDENMNQKTVGLVMAGNIPLVGFHDWMCIFLSGHKSRVKPSSKDEILIKHLVGKMCEWDEEIVVQTHFTEMLKGCDVYIATGSNNSARYFDYYFGKYPNIIRRNRTSVALLTGNESEADLVNLADDVHLYFGLGCRNVTKIYTPESYDFVPLLEAFRKYAYFSDHHKYKNNFDYQLAIHLINRKYYMTNGSILLSENPSVFSPISQLNYEFYTEEQAVVELLENNQDIQCITGNRFVPFGFAQSPSLTDYADGIDTMKFLLQLPLKVA
jgi:hypothetical protein